jgi:hypothetical protein
VLALLKVALWREAKALAAAADEEMPEVRI